MSPEKSARKSIWFILNRPKCTICTLSLSITVLIIQIHFCIFLVELTQDWSLCADIIRTAATHCDITIPITVKIRLQPTDEATVEFALLLASAGASLVAVHGRQRGRWELNFIRHIT
jgi:hypothetical protein